MKKYGIAAAILLLAIIVAGMGFISMFAPFSGAVWTLDTGKKVIENPYGRAEVYYDEYGVPRIVAENEKALYFAIGYVQAKDRLFQMDLNRRLMKGQLSGVFGDALLDSDVFHVKMDFVSAAEASLQAVRQEDPEFASLLDAYAEGVNRYISSEKLPMEFQLLDYKPEPWKPVDTLLIGKAIEWGLTGEFWDLKRAVLIQKFGKDVLELYPMFEAHNYTIVSEEEFAKADWGKAVNWLEQFEGDADFGSNNWVISGKLTESGKPILANDPHLLLTVPPIWYEMHIRVDGDYEARGVTFPGIPTIVIGRNDFVAWGFTNVGADVIDFYSYVWKGEKYLYKGRWLEPEKEVRKIRVKTDRGFIEKDIVVEKTVHGPIIEKEGMKVAVAWTGLTGTREALALYKYNHARSMKDFLEALRYFDVPAQNTVYADVEGNIMYYPAGKFPIRYVDGKMVAGNVIFNGSRGDGEWIGFKPYGISTWEGFIPFEEIPHLINPDYVGTANQRIVPEEYGYYLGDSMYFADPYRGIRIFKMIEAAIKRGEKIDAEYVKEMQRDVYSKPAEFFVPMIIEAYQKKGGEELKPYIQELKGWDYRMTKDSKAALIFALWLEKFMNETFDEFFAAGLDQSYFPRLWVVQNLDAASPWFDDRRTPEKETRDDIALRALRLAAEEMKEKGWQVYGDYNRLRINHPFGSKLAFLNYPSLPMDGSKYTIFNFRVKGNQAGSSWRMIVDYGGKSYCVIPGGNSGNYFSKHYDDQLEMWARGEYKPMDMELRGEKVIEFIGR